MNKKVEALIGFFISAGIFALLYLSISAISKYLGNPPPPSTRPSQAITPNQELPTSSSSQSSSEIVNPSVDLITSSTLVAKNPFDPDEYSKFPRLAMSGSFVYAKLHIEGTVKTEAPVYLLINFNEQGGLVKAVRKATNQLDIAATEKLGGEFTQANLISEDVDLLNDTLGTIGAEYQSTHKGQRTFNLLDNPQKPNVATAMIIPFTSDGQYGGASIDEMKIEYTCELGKTCMLGLCTEWEKATNCMKNYKFNQRMIDDWAKPRMKNSQ